MLKNLLKALEAAEKETDRLDALWNKEPENEEIEAAWDKAYKTEYDAREAVKKYIMKLTGIDQYTAGKMTTSKYRDRLKTIAEKEWR